MPQILHLFAPFMKQVRLRIFDGLVHRLSPARKRPTQGMQERVVDNPLERPVAGPSIDSAQGLPHGEDVMVCQDPALQLAPTTIHRLSQRRGRCGVYGAVVGERLEHVEQNLRIARGAQGTRGISQGCILTLVDGAAYHVAKQTQACAGALDAFSRGVDFGIRGRSRLEVRQRCGKLCPQHRADAARAEQALGCQLA